VPLEAGVSPAGPPFLAVDWGTSSFRAWVLDRSGAVLAETRSAEGMDVVAGGDFEAVLRARLADLGSALDRVPRPLPIVLCGMVGARQGWREAGYLDVPVALSEIADRATVVPAEGLDARILPGLAHRSPQRPDVMRGEETQLLGLVLDEPHASGLVCMPGTHSKWVTLEEGRVTDFRTIMTGELFAVLSRESILRHTIGGAQASGDPQAPAFTEGLSAGLENPGLLGAGLFSIRADGLLFGLSGSAAADRLSGLLIGAEVAGALAAMPTSGPLHFVATGRLARLYGAALRTVGRPVTPVDADDAVRAGLLHAARRFWPVGEGTSS
jgi:2-dehydro-3-deoxygalactonokinase